MWIKEWIVHNIFLSIRVVKKFVEINSLSHWDKVEGKKATQRMCKLTQHDGKMVQRSLTDTIRKNSEEGSLF